MDYSSCIIHTDVLIVGGYLHYSPVRSFMLLTLRLWGDVRVY
jgi:hypothetical protein